MSRSSRQRDPARNETLEARRTTWAVWAAFVARLGILVVSASVLFGLVPIVAREWKGQDACPPIGSLPACYLVFAGYCAIAFSVLLRLRRSDWIFLGGWLTVFSLAFVGSSLELAGQHTCPRSAADIPMCFFSLGIAIGLAAAYGFARRHLGTGSFQDVVSHSRPEVP